MSMVLIAVGIFGVVACVILLIIYNVNKKPLKIPFILLGLSILLLFVGISAMLLGSTADALKPTTANEGTQPSTTTVAAPPGTVYQEIDVKPLASAMGI